MEKIDWKKVDKKIYLPSKLPSIINIPKYKYFTIEGIGNPNEEPFSKCIEILYKFSYTIKMLYKTMDIPGYYEYSVYPLEGIWDINDKTLYKIEGFNKNNLKYELMIRQPDFITEELFNYVLDKIKNKTKNNLCDKVKYKEIEEGLCVQILHIGSFDTETDSFEILNKYIQDNNYKKRDLFHKEIYLSDFRKTKQENLKTVLRYYI